MNKTFITILLSSWIFGFQAQAATSEALLLSPVTECQGVLKARSEWRLPANGNDRSSLDVLSDRSPALSGELAKEIKNTIAPRLRPLPDGVTQGKEIYQSKDLPGCSTQNLIVKNSRQDGLSTEALYFYRADLWQRLSEFSKNVVLFELAMLEYQSRHLNAQPSSALFNQIEDLDVFLLSQANESSDYDYLSRLVTPSALKIDLAGVEFCFLSSDQLGAKDNKFKFDLQGNILSVSATPCGNTYLETGSITYFPVLETLFQFRRDGHVLRVQKINKAQTNPLIIKIADTYFAVSSVERRSDQNLEIDFQSTTVAPAPFFREEKYLAVFPQGNELLVGRLTFDLTGKYLAEKSVARVWGRPLRANQLPQYQISSTQNLWFGGENTAQPYLLRLGKGPSIQLSYEAPEIPEVHFQWAANENVSLALHSREQKFVPYFTGSSDFTFSALLMLNYSWTTKKGSDAPWLRRLGDLGLNQVFFNLDSEHSYRRTRIWIENTRVQIAKLEINPNFCELNLHASGYPKALYCVASSVLKIQNQTLQLRRSADRPEFMTMDNKGRVSSFVFGAYGNSSPEQVQLKDVRGNNVIVKAEDWVFLDENEKVVKVYASYEEREKDFMCYDSTSNVCVKSSK